MRVRVQTEQQAPTQLQQQATHQAHLGRTVRTTAEMEAVVVPVEEDSAAVSPVTQDQVTEGELAVRQA